MSKITNTEVTCKMCQSFHDARRCICKSWCESTEFYVEGDDVVCARYVTREMRS